MTGADTTDRSGRGSPGSGFRSPVPPLRLLPRSHPRGGGGSSAVSSPWRCACSSAWRRSGPPQPVGRRKPRRSTTPWRRRTCLPRRSCNPCCRTPCSPPIRRRCERRSCLSIGSCVKPQPEHRPGQAVDAGRPDRLLRRGPTPGARLRPRGGRAGGAAQPATRRPRSATSVNRRTSTSAPWARNCWRSTARYGRRNRQVLLLETYSRYDAVNLHAPPQLWRGFAGITLTSMLLLLVRPQAPLSWALVSRPPTHANVSGKLGWRMRCRRPTDERRRIAATLHDGPVQELAASAFLVAGAADRARAAGDDANAGQLELAASSVRSSIGGLRSLLVDIYPPALSSAGLGAALQDSASALRARGVEVTVDVPEIGDLPPAVEALVFRRCPGMPAERRPPCPRHPGRQMPSAGRRGENASTGDRGRRSRPGPRRSRRSPRRSLRAAAHRGPRRCLPRDSRGPIRNRCRHMLAHGGASAVTTDPVTADPVTADPVPAEPVRIVLVDDHALGARRLGGPARRSSRHRDRSPGQAADGEEALRVVLAVDPDVVLMDLSMPGTDGVTATRRIVAERPETQVLVLTRSRTGPGSVRRSLRAPSATCSRTARPRRSSPASVPPPAAAPRSTRVSRAPCSPTAGCQPCRH